MGGFRRLSTSRSSRAGARRRRVARNSCRAESTRRYSLVSYSHLFYPLLHGTKSLGQMHALKT